MAGLFGAPEESEAVRSLCNSGTLAAPALAAEVGWNRLPRPHARPFPSRREVLARRQSQADGAGRFERVLAEDPAHLARRALRGTRGPRARSGAPGRVSGYPRLGRQRL